MAASTTSVWVLLVSSFFGGGIMVGVVSWVRQSISERTKRKIDYLQDQIRYLYGPLYFFTAQNENLFKLNLRIMGAYEDKYVAITYSEDPTTQERIRKDASTTIELGNEYIDRVKLNNEKIVNILTDNYAFIDPDDTNLLQNFIVDYTRLKVEVEEKRNLDIPWDVLSKIGVISYMSPELIERVERKFHRKVSDVSSFQISWFEKLKNSKLKKLFKIPGLISKRLQKKINQNKTPSDP